MDPLYPVARIERSRTTTAPTNLRSQVERVATSRAMFMKYSSQDALCLDMAGLSRRIGPDATLTRLCRRSHSLVRAGP